VTKIQVEVFWDVMTYSIVIGYICWYSATICTMSEPRRPQLEEYLPLYSHSLISVKP